MSVEAFFGNDFKPEVRSSGRKLFLQDKVNLSSGSETAVQAFVKGSPPAKVNLSSHSVQDPLIIAACSCPVARKGRLCKHIWATLLQAEVKYPDFLLDKNRLEKLNSEGVTGASAEVNPKKDYQENAKARASEYRKTQYQKQKDKLKAKKNDLRHSESSKLRANFSEEEDLALQYFSENGFPMPNGPSREILVEAKRKLSRVFHPDKGGTHEETVILNQNYEVLLAFFTREF